VTTPDEDAVALRLYDIQATSVIEDCHLVSHGNPRVGQNTGAFHFIDCLISSGSVIGRDTLLNCFDNDLNPL
jgi:hypothetical protein